MPECGHEPRSDEPDSGQADVAHAEHDGRCFDFVREPWFLEGYMALSCGCDRLFFTTQDREVNATLLFKLNGVPTQRMTQFLFQNRDLERRILKRSRPEGGTYVKLDVARRLCDHFGLSWNPIDRIFAHRASRHDSSYATTGKECPCNRSYVEGVGSREGYMALSYRGRLVFFTIQDRKVNATQLFKLEGRPLNVMHRYLTRRKIKKHVVNGGVESGTCVVLDAARELCTKLGLTCVPVDKVKAYQPRQVG
ncbi:uncharacterized protein HRG_10736 [Hirsutella rhossiliensis]|uniref:Uncharacterized protein n=1 Tax=Hirsutella rhossiliensis TaxID=111463 RepID=A0A9P8SEH5_9HYPO|nr:uncharacterized protein HRG_10736 [Hirsutella rhossiliensis]KAH0958041.1 hypothetical protein HRG_10736 [Hirsutella rhossiliensis]